MVTLLAGLGLASPLAAQPVAPAAAPQAAQTPPAGAETASPAVTPQDPPAAPPAARQVPSPTSPTPPPANPEGPRTVVIDAAPIGVDAQAGAYVTEVLRSGVAALGFRVLPTTELYAAAQALQLPFPVPPDGVFTLERALQAPVAVAAEVRASGGRYIVTLRVRVAVEATERTREVSADQFELAEQLRAALPAMLVPPDVAPPVEAPRASATAPVPRVRRIRAHPRRWELGGGLNLSLGPGRDSFVNALGVLRLGYFPQDRLGFTLSVDYANLRGRNERVSNALVLLGVETAVDLVPRARVFIPLRAEVGYLPLNGPVFRITAGVMFQLARRVRLEVDLLSPTFWVLPSTSPVSLDLAATLHFGL